MNDIFMSDFLNVTSTMYLQITKKYFHYMSPKEKKHVPELFKDIYEPFSSLFFSSVLYLEKIDYQIKSDAN